MKICILTPIKDSVPGPAHSAMVDFAIEATKRGHNVTLKTSWLSSNLAQARCLLVREALTSDAERVMLVDDDILFSPDHAFALLALNEDVLAGCYKKRLPNGETIGDPLEGGEVRGALLEMRRIGLGFTVVTRSCLERLIERHGGGLFEFVYDGSRMLGEDEVFCDRWRAMGGRIWLHTGIRLGHIGPQVFT